MVTLEQVLRYIEDSRVNYILVDKKTRVPSAVWPETKLPVVYGDKEEALADATESDEIITEFEFIKNYVELC